MPEPIGVDQDTADQGKVDPTEGGFVDDLAWLGRGFFQTLYSLQFYRAAAQNTISIIPTPLS